MRLTNTKESLAKIERANRELRAANAKNLVGKLVRYTVPFHDMKGRHHAPGEYRGRVVSVVAGPRMGFRSCKVARPSNPDARTLVGMYNAEPCRVYPEWITGVKHRNIKTLRGFLGA